MATKFLETPDATQSTQWWTTVSGSVTYDTTAASKKSGLASWKCDSGAGVASYLRKDVPTLYRLSVYVCITNLPASSIHILRFGVAWLGVSSAGVLRLFTDGILRDTGSTLTAGTVYRICLAVSSSGVKVFLDGVQDISVANSVGAASFVIVGWYTSPGANKVLNFQHVYVDDVTDLTDTGDIRVTAKLPDELNDNNYDTTGGTGAVNERPLSETNYMMHAAKSSVLQDWTLETAAEGDVDISGDTLVARCAWMWAMSSKVDDTIYIVDNGNSATGWADQVTATLNTKITDSAVYPSNAAGIGQKSGAASPDEYLYECGTLIAYIVAVVGGDTFYETAVGAITFVGTSARTMKFARSILAGVLTPVGVLLGKAKKFLSGALTSSGTIARKVAVYFTGALTFVGTAAKKMAVSLAGTFSSSGVVTLVKIYIRSFAGTLTTDGAVTGKAKKVLTGALISSGALIGKAKKVLSGAITYVGTSLRKMVFARTILVGALTLAGTVINKTGKVFAGALTISGILVGKAKKFLAGTLTSGGDVVKKTAKLFAGAITFIGTVAAEKVTGLYYKTVEGVVTFTGVLAKKSEKVLSGIFSSIGTLIATKVGGVLYYKTLVGAATFIGVVSRETSRILLGAANLAGAVTRQVKKVFAGAFTGVGVLTKKAFKVLTGALSSVGTLIANKVGVLYYKALAGAIILAGAVGKRTSRILLGTASFTGTISKLTRRLLSGALTFIGYLFGHKGMVHLTLYDRSTAFTLAARSTSFTLWARSVALTLAAHPDVFTLKPRIVTLTLPTR